MAAVTVFVDDAVRGTLPRVCAKEGVATNDRLTQRNEVGGGAGRLGVAVLLVLAGPLGWLALFIIACMRRPTDWITVRLPLSDYAYRRHRVAQRMRTTWLVASFTAAVLAIAPYSTHRPASTATASLFLLFALVALGAGLHEWYRVRKTAVHVALDASRRWVTLSGVHPDFVRAVQEQQDHSLMERH